MIALIRELIDNGHEVVLWTTRNGEELIAAVDWCGDYGLHFSNVNGPAPSNEAEYKDKYETMSRKIYADIYIDDHNLEFAMTEYHTLSAIDVATEKLKRGMRKWQTKEN